VRSPNVEEATVKATERSFEPWPWGVALSLVIMISTCIGFWWLAITHPDRELTQDTFSLEAEQ